MAGWDNLSNLLLTELKQRNEEGCHVEGYLEIIKAAGHDEKRLMEVYDQLMKLPIRSDFHFNEPNELVDIQAERPDGPRKLERTLTDEVWQDRFYGAWLGRSAGCALGKPLENQYFMRGTTENPGWKNIKLWFEGANAWPMNNYTPGHSKAEKEQHISLNLWCQKSILENIKFMETDDDIRYTVLGLILLEEKGADFTSYDVGKLWQQRLTYSQVCTAETQAYRNFSQISIHTKDFKPQYETSKDWVRTYLNPYREWIGAQIRADGLAYGAAGNPELAAEFAWRDASFSHVKNGIYGEMFIAAMIAAAFVEQDIEKVIEIGLSEIPRNCRLAADIRQAIEITRSATDQVELVDRIWEAFKHYDPVHTNNNAALVTAALLFAAGDFEKAITTAVLGGWDTDCNGATVGSIMGAMLGASHLPEKWTTPLNDTLYAEVHGFHPIAISECAERSYQVFRKMNQ